MAKVQLSFGDSPDYQRQQLEQLARAYRSLHSELHEIYDFCRTVYLAMHFDLCTDEDMDLDGKWRTHSVVRGISDKHDGELSEILTRITQLDHSAYETLRKMERGSFDA